MPGASRRAAAGAARDPHGRALRSGEAPAACGGRARRSPGTPGAAGVRSRAARAIRHVRRTPPRAARGGRDRRGMYPDARPRGADRAPLFAVGGRASRAAGPLPRPPAHATGRTLRLCSRGSHGGGAPRDCDRVRRPGGDRRRRRNRNSVFAHRRRDRRCDGASSHGPRGGGPHGPRRPRPSGGTLLPRCVRRATGRDTSRRGSRALRANLRRLRWMPRRSVTSRLIGVAAQERHGRMSTELRIRVSVVVLGEVGRSPRTQYHALALASAAAEVDVIGYAGSTVHPAVGDDERIRWHLLPPRPQRARLPDAGVSFAVRSAVRVIRESLRLLWLLLLVVRKPDIILIQNPPAIPTLLIALIA